MAGREKQAGASLTVPAINNFITPFPQARDVANPDVSGRMGQRETAIPSAPRHKITLATQRVHGLDQIMARNVELFGHIIHRHPLRMAHGGLHQDPKQVVGVKIHAHAGTPYTIENFFKLVLEKQIWGS